MPDSWSLSNGLVAINRLGRSITTNLNCEEQLVQVQPSRPNPVLSSSLLTNELNDLPLLLECLAGDSHQDEMPPRTPLSDPFHGIDDLDFFAVDEVPSTPPYCPALQEETSEHTKPQQQVVTTMNQIDQDLLRDDYELPATVELDSYSLSAVLDEARSYYQGSTIPEFCIKKPAHTTRQVLLSDAITIADLEFHAWNDTLGYWVLTDGVRDSYIVKHVTGRYFVWESVDTKFADEPAAYVLKQNQKNDLQKARKSKQPECGLVSIHTGSLRPRTTRQSMPYTMYNTQKKYDDKGVRLTEAELEDVVIGYDTSPTKEAGRGAKKRKQTESSRVHSKPEDHRISISSEMVSSSMSSAVSNEYMLSHTVFRTRFHGFDSATIPILAEKYSSNESLFEAIKSKWAFKLEGQQLMYCIASFSWLHSDKSILLQELDHDGFDNIMQEVRYAPAWDKEGRVEVVVEIFS